jgi:hypothetical protein
MRMYKHQISVLRDLCREQLAYEFAEAEAAQTAARLTD